MTVLDQLYQLEIEFHRCFRAQAVDAMEAWSIHTSYALQHGYEPLLRSLGGVGPAELIEARERLVTTSDPRDVHAAFHSLRHLVARD